MRRGRKSKYETHVKPYFDEILSWRQSGISEKDIAKKLNVGETTYFDYKTKYPEFADLVRYGKERLISNLKKALYREAMGYDYTEKENYIEEIPVINKSFNPKEPISDINQQYIYKKKRRVRENTKFARPQSQLLIFALCNLDPSNFTRVDKEAIKELEEEMKARQNVITDDRINEAFKVLNPHVKMEGEDDKNKKET